jgi:hypothetical protein
MRLCPFPLILYVALLAQNNTLRETLYVAHNLIARYPNSLQLQYPVHETFIRLCGNFSSIMKEINEISTN